ncbi:MAG: hypothetical protein JRG91_04275 [Deltaproteobacteria bacterium]|nr:hypothetical protein [Deltaproteobacteria bacterium]
MMKILLPLLVLAGLGLGVFLLLRRRHVEVPRGGSWIKVVVLTAAALVVGTVSMTDANGKPQKTCYMPAQDPDFYPALEVDHMKVIEQRIELLEKLHEQGKLTDAVYRQTLASIQANIEEAELEKKNKKALSKAEKKLIGVRQALDGKLIKKLNKQAAWAVLNKQVRQLLKLVDGKKNTYDADKVDEAIATLHSKGLIDAATRSALSTVLDEVQYNHERSHSGKTCYKVSKLGWQMKSSRGNLTIMLQSIGGKKMTGKKFAESLGILATSVSCLQKTSKDACEAAHGTYDRVSMVQTLDILISLAK